MTKHDIEWVIHTSYYNEPSNIMYYKKKHPVHFILFPSSSQPREDVNPVSALLHMTAAGHRASTV